MAKAKVKVLQTYRIQTGVSGGGPYAPLILETAAAGLRVTSNLFGKLSSLVAERAPDRTRDKLIARLDGAVVQVYDRLVTEGLKRSTAERYASVTGDFLIWCGGKWFTSEDIGRFLQFLAVRSLEGAQKRFGKPSATTGMAVVRLGFYALKKVFDDLCEMDVVGDLPPPPRPDPIAPAAPGTVDALYAEAGDDADELLLLLTNGLDLRVGKAARLNWSHVDSQCRNVTVQHGEGTRSVPVRPDLQPHLRRLRPRAGADTALFPSRRKPDRSGVSIRALQYRLTRLVTASGLQEHVTLTALCKARTVAAA